MFRGHTCTVLQLTKHARRKLLFLIYVWVPEVGNTADTPNPPWVIYPFKGNLGVPTGQRKFDLGGV